MTYVRVVLVDWTGNYTDGKVVKIEVAGRDAVVPLDDVIELTEERLDVPGKDANGFLTGDNLLKTRLVSEWKVTP